MSWKVLFETISKIDVFAKWNTKSGGYVYMYFPDIDEIGDFNFEGDAVMEYEDIVSIDIPEKFMHGNLQIKNNFPDILRILDSIADIDYKCLNSEISIKLKDA